MPAGDRKPAAKPRARQETMSIEGLYEMVHGLGEKMEGLDERLRGHMDYEEERYRSIDSGIGEIKIAVEKAQDAMPQDGTGRPDFFRHRQDHELINEYRNNSRADKRRMRDKLLDLAPYAVLLVIVTHGDKILKMMHVME